MSIFDFSLLVIIAGFGLFGLWFGLIHTLGSMVGTVLGVYLAVRYFEPVAALIVKYTGWGGNLPKVLMFAIAFIVINRLVGLLFWILGKGLGLVTRLPFIRSLDRLLGLIFGLVEGVLVLGVCLYFIGKFPVGEGFMGALKQSRVAPELVKPVSVMLPLVPEAIKTAKGALDNWLPK